MKKFVCSRWAVDLSTWSPTLAQLTQAIAAVQPEERERLKKFYFAEDFHSSLIGRLLMRKFVCEATGINYHQIHFSRDERGKPYLDMLTIDDEERPQVTFNVSHQGDFVVLAGLVTEEINSIEVDCGVGVDVMKIEYSGGKPLNEFFRLMKNKFSDHEWRYINRNQHNERDRLKAFMRHWCLKESYVKELGVGITIDLQKISFSVDSESELCLQSSPLTNTLLRCNERPMTNWHFEEHMLNPKYCAAIAFRNCQPDVGQFETLRIDDLLIKHTKATDLDIVEYCKKALQKPWKNQQ